MVDASFTNKAGKHVNLEQGAASSGEPKLPKETSAFSYLVFALNLQIDPPMHRRKLRAGRAAAQSGHAIDPQL